MKEDAIHRLQKYPKHSGNHYISLQNNTFWDPYRQDADFIELLEVAKIKYDERVKKYGPYVDEFLKTNN